MSAKSKGFVAGVAVGVVLYHIYANNRGVVVATSPPIA